MSQPWNKKNLLLLLPLSATVVCAEVFSSEPLIDTRSVGMLKSYSRESLLPSITNFIQSRPFLDKYSAYVSVKLPPNHRNSSEFTCLHQPALSLPNNTSLQSRLMIQAECSYPTAWQQRIPVQVSIHYPVVTTNQPLQRGDIITNAQLTIKPIDILTLHDGFFDKFEDVLGHVTKQSIASGRGLSPRLIEAPKLIKRGDFVSIFTRKPGFDIKTKGKALNDGVLGSKIKVENLHSKRVVEGVVTAPQQIEVFL